MSEMTTPLQWAAPRADRQPVKTSADCPAAGNTADDAPAQEEQLLSTLSAWPTPPFAAYPAQAEQGGSPQACEIVGLNGVRRQGRLISFLPDQAVAQLLVPPARAMMEIRFAQFKSLTLTEPLRPILPSTTDPHAAILAHRTQSSYCLKLNDGSDVKGETIGHVENSCGLFLFPPVDKQGSVHRLFIPRQAYVSVEIGQRIGELLSEHTATPEKIALAIEHQKQMREQKLGEVLVTRQVLTPEQLLSAIAQQASMPAMRIGDALLALGLATQQRLDDALSQQKSERNIPLGEILINMGIVSRDDLQVALARKMGYPLVKLDEFPVEADALRAVPFRVALRLNVMPLLIRDKQLIVAISNPVHPRAIVEEINFITQLKAIPVLAQCESMDNVRVAAYEKSGIEVARLSSGHQDVHADTVEELGTDKLLETLEREGDDELEADQQIEQSDNSLVRLINTLIIDAYKSGVSDIHVESYPGRNKIQIRFRKDGSMRTHLELPYNYRNAMIARIKIMCDLDISERRRPQDGKINFAKFSPRHKIELRVATIPTNNGLEDVVMRILASAKPLPIDKVALSPRNLSELKRAMGRPYGMVLCVGPTGSGKTTTLHSALGYINEPERKIWTAEDPVEITQVGLRQVQVNPKIDWTFAKALRAFLRADPDVIMVGEIRDAETAHMAVEASLTGHLVLSTLHTNSAPETVTRLLDMGMDPFNFADSLLAVLAQRLVKRLCSHCRTHREATAEEVDELLDDYLHVCPKDDPQFARETVLSQWIEHYGRDGKLLRFHSPGCEHCDQSGQKGRTGIHELMPISREMRHLIQTGTRAEAMQQTALREGMRTLRQDGIEKVLQGFVSIEEVRATSNS